MLRKSLLTAALSLSLPLSAQSLAHQPVLASSRTPILVELFTSEGCSSCPPADALLASLDSQQPVASADIIVLEEHVDYWDLLGWHDRFSSHQYTDRQSAYARAFGSGDVYTPQMVVDGTAQFVGNDQTHALRAISLAAHTPKLPLILSPLTLDGTRLTGTVSIPSSAHLPGAALYAVLIQSSASTKVLHGENGGHTLAHVSVVRSMQQIGSLDALAHHPVPFALTLPPNESSAAFRVVIFAQRTGQGAVLAAAVAAPSPSPAPGSPASSNPAQPSSQQSATR